MKSEVIWLQVSSTDTLLITTYKFNDSVHQTFTGELQITAGKGERKHKSQIDLLINLYDKQK